MSRTRRRSRCAPLRTAVAVCGELVVTVGVLALLYLVWLFWWTSVVAGRHAADAVEAFAVAAPAGSAQPAELRIGDPPVLPAAEPGETIGLLRVPRWSGLTANAMPVVEGTGADVLDRAAAGHYPGTQMPGDVGNVGLAGHRRTYGNSFRYVDRLRVGDPIVIETAETWYVYEVTGWEIVHPASSDVVAPVPHHPERAPTARMLTLTTCHSLTTGEYGNDHRWITYAELVGWLPRGDGTPAVLTATPR
ncbi:class E sortase [Cellulomonas hominis]|uniref:Class E sortase n=1 Tax=Cellulomonas hominis TaxID=156981 RepID=A0A7Z8K221_9CELL|nr:class E sortase [Cellulomonas hominis]TKR27318.1 class E sortase [Cellulomonas hominis]